MLQARCLATGKQGNVATWQWLASQEGRECCHTARQYRTNHATMWCMPIQPKWGMQPCGHSANQEVKNSIPGLQLSARKRGCYPVAVPTNLKEREWTPGDTTICSAFRKERRQEFFWDFHEKIQDGHRNLLVHGRFKHKKCTASQQPHSKVVSSN